MTYKRHLVGYSKTVTSTRLVIDGIKFFRTVFPKDSTSIYRYERSTPHNLRMGIYVQTEGERTDGLHNFSAGWVSREELEKVVPAGVYVLTSITDCVLWCCLGLGENEPTPYMRVVRLKAGERLSLGNNDNLLVISGSIQGQSEGQHIRVMSTGAEVVADSPSMAFAWNSLQLIALYSDLAQ